MVLMFPQAHSAQIMHSEAPPRSTVIGKLNTEHSIISQQAETMAIQQTEIETAHKTEADAEAALARAEDETEAAHLQWMDCLQKLRIAEMSRELT